MNETATPDVPVDPSPTTETAAPVERPSLTNLSREQRQEWRKTGELPAPKPEESAPSTEPAVDAQPVSEPAPASQPDTSKSRQKNADTRKAELQREIQDLLKQRDTLKRETQPGDSAAPPPASAHPAKPDPAKDDPKPTDRLNPATGKPWDGPTGWQDYQEALLAWNRREAVREMQRANQQTEQERRAQESVKKIADGWNQRVAAAVKDLKVTPEDYEAKVSEQLLPHLTPVISQFLLESDAGAKVAWYLAENPATTQQIKGLKPLDAARALFRIEQSLTADPSTPTPAPKTTRTPKPAADLGARNAAPADEEEAAVARGDFRAFKQVANAKHRRN